MSTPSPRPRPARPRPHRADALCVDDHLTEQAAAEPRLPSGTDGAPRAIRVPSLLATLRLRSAGAPGSTANVVRGASVGAIAVGAALFVVAGLTSPAAGNLAAKYTPKPRGTASTTPVMPAFSGVAAAPAAATVPPKTSAPKAPSDPAAISALAGNGIPKVALNAYRVAAARVNHSDSGCHIHWSLLAGIGRVESNHGRYAGSSLRSDGTSTPPIVGPALTGTTWEYFPAAPQYVAVTGDSTYAHALGPMQFIPSTWRSWGSDANGDGKADVFNINDAALAAARYLCAAGGDLGTQAGKARAVHAYNHNDTYVAQVLALADAYKRGVPVTGIPVGDITGTLPKIGHTGSLPPVNPAAPPASDKKPSTTSPKPGNGGKSGGSGSGGGTAAGGSTPGGGSGGGSNSGGGSGSGGGSNSGGGSDSGGNSGGGDSGSGDNSGGGSGGSDSGGGSGGGSGDPSDDPTSDTPTDPGTPTSTDPSPSCSLDLLGSCLDLG